MFGRKPQPKHDLNPRTPSGRAFGRRQGCFNPKPAICLKTIMLTIRHPGHGLSAWLEPARRRGRLNAEPGTSLKTNTLTARDPGHGFNARTARRMVRRNVEPGMSLKTSTLAARHPGHGFSDGRSVGRLLYVLAMVLFATATALAQPTAAKKVFIITDLEGVDGIFNFDLQCIPYKSPRYAESQKLLTDETRAAVDGLAAAGATEITVYDGHYGGQNLSVGNFHRPEVRLLLGQPVSPTLQLDRSYSALVFIGLHAMAGTEDAILPHSYSWDIQNLRVNGRKVGEIGGRVMLAGAFGVPAIMLSGDTAACKEFHDLAPQGQCAEVKSGVSASAGFMLTHAAACDLIRQKARYALEHLGESRPFLVSGPVELKVEYVTNAAHHFAPREGVEQVDERTWVFRGKDLMDAWLKYGSF